MKGYLTARQVCVLVSTFPQGKVWIYNRGHPSKDKDKVGKRAGTATSESRPNTHHGSKGGAFHFFGTYRVELVIALMPHIVDIFNLDVCIIADTLLFVSLVLIFVAMLCCSSC